MAEFRKTINLALDPDKLVELLVSSEFHEEREKSKGTLEVTYKETSRDGDMMRFELGTKEYAKGVTGVDKSKTETNSTSYVWNLKTRHGQWVHTTPHGDRVKVTGTIDVKADGQGSALTDVMVVQVKIPLVGRKIEKMVMSGIEKGWPTYRSVVERLAKKAAAQ